MIISRGPKNGVAYSEDLDQWVNAGGATVVADQTTSPEETANADRVDDDGSGANGYIAWDYISGLVDGTYTYALPLKEGTTTVASLLIYDTIGAAVRASTNFHWVAGVLQVLAVGVGRGWVETLGDGWYKAIVSGDGLIVVNNNRALFYPSGQGVTQAGNIFAWGAQANPGNIPDDYRRTREVPIS